MALKTADRVLGQLRRSVLVQNEAGQSDAELLNRFIGQRDHSAFEVLVRRHGPMVWGVCNRLLSDRHDAEDAFQATFLVLVRKASSVMPREMVANWLYGVARQIALRARCTTFKRKSREKQVAAIPEPETISPESRHDLLSTVDGELSHLPAKYRTVVI